MDLRPVDIAKTELVSVRRLRVSQTPIGLAGNIPTGATALTSAIMVLFFSSAGSVTPATGTPAFLIRLSPFSVVLNPAVVIYMGKDKHESESHLPPPDNIHNSATIQLR